MIGVRMSDKKHIHVLSELYAHPIAHNIKWQELIPGLTSVGIIYTDKNGSHHFTRNGHTVVLGHANRDNLDAEEILKLRHFISTSAVSQNETPGLAQDIIVAIDHHQAIIFHAPGTAFETRTEQHADQVKFRVLHKHPTSPPFSNNGPDIDDEYYDAMINEMSKARRIVVLGHGTGTSNAASQLIAKLFDKNPEIAHRIAAIQRCDLEAMSEPQMISLGEQLLRLNDPVN
jgi:hypothetical protein